MDLRGYLEAIRKGWWIVLAALILGAGAAVLLTARTNPQYQSSVTFFVSTPSDAAGTAVQANQYAQQRVVSYAALLTSDKLANRILQTSKPALDMKASDLTKEIVSSVQLNTVLVTATITDHSPSRSLRIATGIATQFDPMIAELDNRSTSKTPTVVLNVTSGPTLNPIAVSPRKTLNLLIGIVVGLFLGVAIAVIREILNTSVSSVAVLQGLSRYPVLGQIGFESSARKSPVLGTDRTRSPRAEALRQVRTNLQFVHLDSPIQVLVVTSSVANEGKSTTATNLSIVFAEAGRRVVLIEADLRRPRIADYLGLERAVGLTNVLVGQVQLEDVLQEWGDTGLTVLPSGSIPPNPSELLGSVAMAALIARLRETFDMIIVDTPPILPVTDAAVVAAHSDGAVVVVRHGRTKRSQVSSALRSLDAVDARVLGCVLNMVPANRSRRKSAYDGYGYYEKSPDSAAPLLLPDVPLVSLVPVAVPPSAADVVDMPAPVDADRPAVDDAQSLLNDPEMPVRQEESDVSTYHEADASRDFGTGSPVTLPKHSGSAVDE